MVPVAQGQRDDGERRLVVMDVAFPGNQSLDPVVLAASIATTESSWLVRFPLTSWLGIGQKRYFDEREFRRDVVRLRLLYSQSGFVSDYNVFHVEGAGAIGNWQGVARVTARKYKRVGRQNAMLACPAIARPTRLGCRFAVTAVRTVS